MILSLIVSNDTITMKPPYEITPKVSFAYRKGGIFQMHKSY